MKVTVLSENLQKGLSLINRAISSRNQLPILSHVLLETKEDKLFLSATDLEIGIETAVAATINEEGSITIPAKLFLDLMNTLPSGKINLFLQNGELQITSAKTKTLLATTPPEEFPKLYEKKGEVIFKIPAKKLQETIKRITFSSNQESTRPALSGILVKQVDEGILFVSTDGYRLSLEEIKVPGANLEKPLIIPAKLLRELQMFREEGNIAAYRETSVNQVLFQQEETCLVGRLIEAEFPNYEKILPTDVASTVTVDKESFLRAVKACAIFARETANIVTLSLQKEKMIVSSKTQTLGENTVEIDAVLTGEENAIAFNARYLLDFLSVVGSEEILFEMTGPLNSGVFRLADNPTYLHLIMPIRTQG